MIIDLPLLVGPMTSRFGIRVLSGPSEQGLQPVQGLGGPGAADPPVGAHVPQPLPGGQPPLEGSELTFT